MVAELITPLEKYAVALGFILDELTEHRLAAGGVEMPPAPADSDVEEWGQLIAQDTLDLDAVAFGGRWIGAERQIMGVKSLLPDPRIGHLGG